MVVSCGMNHFVFVGGKQRKHISSLPLMTYSQIGNVLKVPQIYNKRNLNTIFGFSEISHSEVHLYMANHMRRNFRIKNYTKLK